MSQKRLNELAILSIEQDLLENIEYKSLISNFVTETMGPFGPAILRDKRAFFNSPRDFKAFG